MKSVLTDSILFLKFATLSAIESLRMNPDLFNFIILDNSNNTTISYGPNYTPLMLSGGQQQSFNDIYNALILEEAEKIYNKLITKLINDIIAATAPIRELPLPLPLPSYNNNRN